MEKSGADAYVYAKVCGKLKKAYSGAGADKLFALKSLSEVYSLIFNDEVPAMPENLLARQIEIQAEKKFIEEFTDLLEIYDKPDRVLIDLLQFYEYENLKEIAAALCMKETGMPYVTDLGKYGVLKYENWPDLKKITADSIFEWYNSVPAIHQQHEYDTKLDFQYLKNLWNSVNCMRGECKKLAVKLFAEEISFNNILWVLRLKVYYKMSEEEIIPRLFFADEKAGNKDVLAGEALKILRLDPENFDHWKDWKYSKLLNPHEDGVVWQIDPRWVENKIHSLMLKKYSSDFHKFPLSSLALVCYFKIKQNELDNIRLVTEEIRLGGE